MARKAANKAREAAEPTTIVDPTYVAPAATKEPKTPAVEPTTVEDLSHLAEPTGAAEQADNVTTTDLTHLEGPTGKAQQRAEPQVFTEGGIFVGKLPSKPTGVTVNRDAATKSRAARNKSSRHS
jgi:hypothetical protein